MNWHGTPLVRLAAIVSLIASTRSRSGLRAFDLRSIGAATPTA
jgi:hypothetical protein